VRYLGDTPVPAVDRQWHIWLVDEPRLVAPTLFRYEVVNALRQFVRHGVMAPGKAAQVLAEALALPVELIGDEALHQRALELAGRFSLPAAYDAHYLALAERLGAPLWTIDRRLKSAVGDSLPEVRVVE
jgi:predicted nucleic acid-binding protein